MDEFFPLEPADESTYLDEPITPEQEALFCEWMDQYIVDPVEPDFTIHPSGPVIHRRASTNYSLDDAEGNNIFVTCEVHDAMRILSVQTTYPAVNGTKEVKEERYTVGVDTSYDQDRFQIDAETGLFLGEMDVSGVENVIQEVAFNEIVGAYTFTQRHLQAARLVLARLKPESQIVN